MKKSKKKLPGVEKKLNWRWYLVGWGAVVVLFGLFVMVVSSGRPVA
jgi:hypothetical protein